MTKKDDYQTMILRDTLLDFPELYLEVYVEADRSEAPLFAEMFVRARCTKALTPETADLVVFGGGADVNPIYYGEKAHRSTKCDKASDDRDLKLYKLCLEEGIPMFGVCRGAQFLHVMNGGKLYQHVDKHVGDHPIYDSKNKKSIAKISSVHHQMVMDNRKGGMEIVADTYRSKERWMNDKTQETSRLPDIEAFFYRDTCCFGVQGHPEYRGYGHFQQWALERLMNYVVENPDLELVKKYRRMKPEFILERDARLKEKVKELN